MSVRAAASVVGSIIGKVQPLLGRYGRSSSCAQSAVIGRRALSDFSSIARQYTLTTPRAPAALLTRRSSDPAHAGHTRILRDEYLKRSISDERSRAPTPHDRRRIHWTSPGLAGGSLPAIG